jgi:uncharacterized protein (DUF58 family)
VATTVHALVSPAPFAGVRASARSGALARIERVVGLTASGMAVVASALSLSALARLLDNRAMALTGYGLLFVVAVSWLLGRRKLALSAQRSELPARARPGQLVQAAIELTAKQRTATIVVEEHLDSHLGAPVRVPVPLLSAGQAAEYGYSFTPRVRGVYDVGPTLAEWSDPFGLTRRRQLIAEAETMIVHPRVEPVLDRVLLRAWEDPPIRPPELRPWPTGAEFYGLREYVPGDDPRRIVWRAVAQHDEYLVRESEQGIIDRIKVILDTSRDVHSPGDVSETFEAAVAAVASLARSHLRDGFGLDIETNSGALMRNLRGGGTLIPLLDQLARVKRDQASAVSVLDQAFARGVRMAHHVFVTAELPPAVARRLRLFTDAGASMLVVLCVWDDTDPATIHRAGLIGCNVVEVHANSSLSSAFAHVTAGRR